jgi:hypothetical protein
MKCHAKMRNVRGLLGFLIGSSPPLRSVCGVLQFVCLVLSQQPCLLSAAGVFTQEPKPWKEEDERNSSRLLKLEQAFADFGVSLSEAKG